jgi:crotonobetainyl-CoA:carnitine CoA-transferase CaiB-like acyl-CoA transferase
VTLPLAGYRVLDLSVWQQGTYATTMLADMGADVIKIESYANPDPGRGLGALTGGGDTPNAYFNSLNRGKRSILLDMKTEAGQEVFWRLARDADVFHNNMRGGVMERLGVTYERLQAANPRIIYSNATAWGPVGPHANAGSMDLLAQARGGFMSVTGEADGPPTPAGFPQADHVGALVSGYAIVLALLHRERSGEGQQVDTSLYGSQLCIQSFNIAGALWSGGSRGRTRHEERSPTWNQYQAGDGKWFMIGALPPDKWWAQFCEVMGLPELAADPYRTAAQRMERNAEVVARMDAVFQTRTRDEWVEAFQARGLLVEPVLDYLEIEQDEQAWANDYLVKVPDAQGREWTMVGSPVRMSKTPAQITRMAPEFGQHTEEVLLEAGYSWEDLEALRARGAFGPPA